MMVPCDYHGGYVVHDFGQRVQAEKHSHTVCVCAIGQVPATAAASCMRSVTLMQQSAHIVIKTPRAWRTCMCGFLCAHLRSRAEQHSTSATRLMRKGSSCLPGSSCQDLAASQSQAHSQHVMLKAFLCMHETVSHAPALPSPARASTAAPSCRRPPPCLHCPKSCPA